MNYFSFLIKSMNSFKKTSTQLSSLHAISNANNSSTSLHDSMVIQSTITIKQPYTTSLYHSCCSIIEKLLLVPDIENYIVFTAENIDSNPLNKIWDICRQGIPLAALFNALNPRIPIPIDRSSTRLNDCKKNVYHFIVSCRQDLLLKEEELFTLSDLYKDSINGFIKVKVTCMCNSNRN